MCTGMREAWVVASVCSDIGFLFLLRQRRFLERWGRTKGNRMGDALEGVPKIKTVPSLM